MTVARTLETMMKIYVNRVPVEGMHEDATYDPKTLGIDRFDVRLEEPISLSSFITKAKRELVVQADIRARVGFSCARCLQEFQRPIQTAAILSYEVGPTDIVDITEDVRQEILLAYPMIPVCQEGCKGLCPVCGQNLNVAACVHTSAERNSHGPSETETL